MKKLILISGLFLATTAFAEELQTYSDMVSAISSGKSIRIVTNFTQCSSSRKGPAASMSLASFTPSQIGVTDSYIATSLTHFTLNDPFFPGKPVNEFVRYTITADNNMNVKLHVLDASTHMVLMDPISFNCKVGVATKIYS